MIHLNAQLDKLAPGHFTYDRWAAGSLATLGIETRTHSILANSVKIKRHAIGYCDGRRLFVRPKPDCMAVMFWTPQTGHFWTHLIWYEFFTLFI